MDTVRGPLTADICICNKAQALPRTPILADYFRLSPGPEFIPHTLNFLQLHHSPPLKSQAGKSHKKAKIFSVGYMLTNQALQGPPALVVMTEMHETRFRLLSLPPAHPTNPVVSSTWSLRLHGESWPIL